jgi:hypothetical protein
MLRLPSFDPQWLDLPQGVRVLHKPVTDAECLAASAWARRMADDALADMQAQRLRALDIADNAELDEAQRAKLHNGYLVQAIARLCITAWEGVEGDCTPEAVSLLMRMPMMAEAYLPAAMAPLLGLQAEGNASGAAPNGTTAAAPNTAEDASPAA